MESKYLFHHILSGITMTITSTSLEGAQGILSKIVKDINQWTNYK